MYFVLPNVNHTIYKFIDCVLTENTSTDSVEHDGWIEGWNEAERSSRPTIRNKAEDSGLQPSDSIQNSLAFYLYEIKNKIKKHEKDWDIYKKYTNPYEFINTIIPGKNRCISKYKPLSRSYFKTVSYTHLTLPTKA